MCAFGSRLGAGVEMSCDVFVDASRAGQVSNAINVNDFLAAVLITDSALSRWNVCASLAGVAHSVIAVIGMSCIEFLRLVPWCSLDIPHP